MDRGEAAPLWRRLTLARRRRPPNVSALVPCATSAFLPTGESVQRARDLRRGPIADMLVGLASPPDDQRSIPTADVAGSAVIGAETTANYVRLVRYRVGNGLGCRSL